LRRASIRLIPAPTARPAAVRARFSSVPSGIRNRQLLQVGALAPAYGVPDRERDAVLEPDVGPDHVDEPVDPRGALGVRAGEPRQAERGAFDGDGRVLLGDPDDRAADGARE
jgi:hypothetical protein